MDDTICQISNIGNNVSNDNFSNYTKGLFRKRSMSLNSIYSIHRINNQISKSVPIYLDLIVSPYVDQLETHTTTLHPQNPRKLNLKMSITNETDNNQINNNNNNNNETSFCYKEKERSDDGSISHRASLSPISSTPIAEINNRGFADNNHIRVPIIGYEIMEERARFTVFKLRIENPFTNNCWLVLRRYTDFVRLHNKLKTLIPHHLPLPRKKIFGNNFGSIFLENRVKGLQFYINAIIANKSLTKMQIVRDFFCLDEAPTYSDSVEECRAIFEAQEETIAHLKLQLKDKDDTIEMLKENLAKTIHDRNKLHFSIRKITESCTKCSLDIDDCIKQCGESDII